MNGVDTSSEGSDPTDGLRVEELEKLEKRMEVNLHPVISMFELAIPTRVSASIEWVSCWMLD